MKGGAEMTNGERIKKLRLDRGLTQDELAKLVGYKSRSSINKIELDKQELVQSSIVSFSKALNVSPLELLGIEDEIAEIGKNRPRSEDEWTVLEEKLMLLSDSDLEKLNDYLDGLISEHEEQQG